MSSFLLPKVVVVSKSSSYPTSVDAPSHFSKKRPIKHFENICTVSNEIMETIDDVPNKNLPPLAGRYRVSSCVETPTKTPSPLRVILSRPDYSQSQLLSPPNKSQNSTFSLSVNTASHYKSDPTIKDLDTKDHLLSSISTMMPSGPNARMITFTLNPLMSIRALKDTATSILDQLAKLSFIRDREFEDVKRRFRLIEQRVPIGNNSHLTVEWKILLRRVKNIANQTQLAKTTQPVSALTRRLLAAIERSDEHELHRLNAYTGHTLSDKIDSSYALVHACGIATAGFIQKFLQLVSPDVQWNALSALLISNRIENERKALFEQLAPLAFIDGNEHFLMDLIVRSRLRVQDYLHPLIRAGMTMIKTDIYYQSLSLTRVTIFYGGAIGLNRCDETETSMNNRVIQCEQFNRAVKVRNSIFTGRVLHLPKDLITLIIEYIIDALESEERIKLFDRCFAADPTVLDQETHSSAWGHLSQKQPTDE